MTPAIFSPDPEPIYIIPDLDDFFHPPIPKTRLPGPLPNEILTDILTRHLSSPPTCALSLLCPEWDLCSRHRHDTNPTMAALQTILRIMRVDTYTLPLKDPNNQEGGGGGGGGKIATTFGHVPGGEGCIPLTFMRDPRERYGGHGYDHGGRGLPGVLQKELVRRWIGRSAIVVSQREQPICVGPLWAGVMDPEYVQGMMILRRERDSLLVPYGDDFVDEDTGRMNTADEREKDMLPLLEGEEEGSMWEEPRYLYQRIRHLVVNTVPGHADLEASELGLLPSTWGSETSRNLGPLSDRLEYERRANLLLRWDAMERLETLFLDLRGYSLRANRFLYTDDVMQLARSLADKGLELLVIAGLRSYGYYPSPDLLDIADVESGVWDSEGKMWVSAEDGGLVNWWKMFQKAVRPGGRLVFVDCQDGNELRLLRRDLHTRGMYHY